MAKWLRKPRSQLVFLYSSRIVGAVGIFMLLMVIPLLSNIVTHPVGELILRRVGRTIYGLGAVSALIIWFGMLLFWFQEDRSPAGAKGLWLAIFFVTAWFGAAVYFFRVDRNKSGRTANRPASESAGSTLAPSTG